MRGVAGVCGREKCACDWFIRGGEGESRKKEGVDVEGVCDNFSVGRAFDLKNPVQPDDVQEPYRIEVPASQSAERDLQRAEL